MPMNIDVNIHINSWLKKDKEFIDPILIQLKDNSEMMIVDMAETIRIQFDYPLSQPVVLEFFGKGPWRLQYLIDAVVKGYLEIYDEEDETRTLPAIDMGAMLVNRPQTNGKHGIWGHILNDLYIEKMYKEDDVWHLHMGS